MSAQQYGQSYTFSQVKDWTRGTAVNVQGMDVDRQLEAANLNWTVETSDFLYGDAYQHQEENTKVAYRADTGMFLDTYTIRQPWQNRDIVQTFNDFTKEAELELTHLGSFQEGRSIYAAAYLKASDVLKSGDITEHYLLLKDSHLNGKGMQATLYSNRCICTNGLHTMIRASSKTIAHVGEFDKAKVSLLLEAAIETVKQKETQLEVLASTAIGKEEAMMNLIKAFGDVALPVSEQPKVVQTAMRLFEGEAQGSEMLTAYNTAYGLLQSVTEYYNWHGRKSQASTQFQSVLSGQRANKMAQFERQLVSVYAR